MAKKFTELEAKMSPERRARIDEKVKKVFAEMSLNEFRNASGLSQQGYKSDLLLPPTLDTSMHHFSREEANTR